MTIFKDLSAEDVAAQHQLLIDMILSVMSMNDDALRQRIADSIDKMVDLYGQDGRDTTILTATAASVRRQYGPA